MEMLEKARDLGKEIRKSEQYQELERTTGNVQSDSEANNLVEEIQKIQQQIHFSQQSGVQPSQDQIDQFNEAKGKMDSNLTIQAYSRARNNFEQLMQNVNNAISEGINPENEQKQ